MNKFKPTIRLTTDSLKKKKPENSFITHGIINLVIYIPILFVTSFWGLLIIGIFNLDSITEPFWYVVTMFPLLIPPVSCIAGIIRGLLNIRRNKYALLCFILSTTGIFLYIGFIYLCSWLGSKF